MLRLVRQVVNEEQDLYNIIDSNGLDSNTTSIIVVLDNNNNTKFVKIKL
jgi:hypothetical protein